MPRFVILHHECPSGVPRPSHWDFMLEADGVLRAWALMGQPGGPANVIADSLRDHRLDYLRYEGPLSRGRGVVERWDEGTYCTVEETEAELVVDLIGQKLRGRAVLTRLEEGPQRWRFVFAEG